MRKVVGIHSCSETIKVRPKSIKTVFLREDFESSPVLKSIHAQASGRKINIQKVSAAFLNKWSDGHQGVALEVSEDPVIDWDNIKRSQKSLIVVLDGLEDPQNLGTILRTGWLLGVDGIITTKDRSVGLTTSVCKIASGGAEHVPIEFVTNLSQTLEELKKYDYWIYGLALENSQEIWKTEFPLKTVLVVGHEGTGLREKTIRYCDQLVSIPQTDKLASLNASISLAIAVAEVRRQLR